MTCWARPETLRAALKPFFVFQSFTMRYKGISEHWVGLSREGEEQPWKWVNRSQLSPL